MAEQTQVKIHYKGTLDDGTVFDSSEGREPLEFVEGSHMVIPGFEIAVAEMKPGETKSIHLEPAEAYGDYDPTMVQVAPLDQVPNAEELPVGEVVYFQGPNGEPIPCLVQKIEDGKAYFDFNHSLAGKALNFDLTLVERSEYVASEQSSCGCGSCGTGSCGCDDDSCGC